MRVSFFPSLTLGVALLLGGFGVALASEDDTPGAEFGFGPFGGPLPGARGASPEQVAMLEPEACAGCHEEVASEWEGSMHARSFVDPVFQAELRETAGGEPCRSCHAPMGDASLQASPAHRRGVDCVACHVRGAEVLTATPPAGAVPHGIRVMPEFSGSEFCGSCHDFHFPELGTAPLIPYDPDSPQQMTLTEWRRSEAAARGQGCVDCHMPSVARGGRRGTSHALRSLEDAEFVRGALAVTASARNRDGETQARLELRVRGAGHAVPTGDIFRILRVRVSGCGESAEQLLRREFAEQRGRNGWVLRDSWDGRVMPDAPRVVRLSLPECREQLRYEVSILRTDLENARRRNLPEDYMVVVVDSGEVRLM